MWYVVAAVPLSLLALWGLLMFLSRHDDHAARKRAQRPWPQQPPH